MQWFKPTGGRVTGVLGLVAAVVVVGLGIKGKVASEIVVGGLLFAVLVWVTLLRPRVGLSSDALVLRGMVSAHHIPLAAIDNVTLRQVFAVWAGGRRYVSAAVGLPYYEIMREQRRRETTPHPGSSSTYAHHISDLVDSRARQARADHLPAGEVRREWAWPEVAAIVVLLIALVVTLAL